MTLLSGTLADLDLPGIAEMTSLGRSGLRLELREATGGVIGILVLKAGRVVSAIAGNKRGQEALRVIMSADATTRFHLASEPLASVPNPIASAKELRDVGRWQGSTLPAPVAMALPTLANGPRPDRATSRAQSSAPAVQRVEMMRGRLDEFDLPTLLQSLSVGRQLVDIEIHDRSGQTVGLVSVKSGKLVSARAGDTVGIAAIARLVSSSTSHAFTAFRVLGELGELAALASVAEVCVRLVTDAEEARDRVVMEGSLSEFDLPTLMQTVAAGRQHCALEIHDGPATVGRIHLKAGVVLSATAGERTGLAALEHLVGAHPAERFRLLRLSSDLAEASPLGPVSRVLFALVTPAPAPASAQAQAPASEVRGPPIAPMAAPEPVTPAAPIEPRRGSLLVAPGEMAMASHLGRRERPAAGQQRLRWVVPVSVLVGGAIAFVALRGLQATRPASSPAPPAPAVTAAPPPALAPPPAAPAPSAAVPVAVAPPPVAVAAPPVAIVPPPAPAPPSPQMQATSPATTQLPTEVEAQSRSGTSILNAQVALRRLGYYSGPVDNVYGHATRAAVVQLQQAKRLPITGWLDRETWSVIVAELVR